MSRTARLLPEGRLAALQFLNKGYIVDVASIAGGPVPIDPMSLQPPAHKNYRVKRFLADCECLWPQLQGSAQYLRLLHHVLAKFGTKETGALQTTLRKH